MDTNNISSKLKERFCKDCNIPINVFQEPYFNDRLKLYHNFYLTLNKWARFLWSIEKYDTEQDYFEDYNRIKDEAINSIKSTEAYQIFNECDMNKFAIRNKNISSKDIYHPSNDGKTFISIDMQQANFHALSHFNGDIFNKAETWQDYLMNFTDNDHIIHSKYIRQVILGNCNPKKHITYEKYIMDMILTNILESQYVNNDQIVSLSNDEIIIDVSDLPYIDQCLLQVHFTRMFETYVVPLKVELFSLHSIKGTKGYYKLMLGNHRLDIKLKCVDALYLPFIIRKWNKEEVTELDKTFYYNGLLAKFIEVPDIKF